MYTNIIFGTLQLHAETNSNQTTLYKTVAVYDKENFIFDSNKQVNYKEIKITVSRNSLETRGGYQDLLNQFNWNLN